MNLPIAEVGAGASGALQSIQARLFSRVRPESWEMATVGIETDNNVGGAVTGSMFSSRLCGIRLPDAPQQIAMGREGIEDGGAVGLNRAFAGVVPRRSQ